MSLAILFCCEVTVQCTVVMQSVHRLNAGIVLREVGLFVVQFPAWWYSSGLLKIWRELLHAYAPRRRLFKLRILYKHIFDTMFGDSHWEMHFVSVIVRIPYTLGLTLMEFFIALPFVIILLLWLLVPLLVLTGLLYQLGIFVHHDQRFILSLLSNLC